MKYYSGTGDKSETSLSSGRIKKTDKMIKALGDLDELLAFLGDAHSKIKYGTVKDTIRNLELGIYTISAQISGYASSVKTKKLNGISSNDVVYLEDSLDSYSKNLEPMKKFVYPNGSQGGTALNICRAVARRAERSVLDAGVSDEWILKYMNRISSLLFVMFRFINKSDNYKEDFF